MMRSNDIWTEEAATQDAAVGRLPYEGPVPSAVLNSSDVMRDDPMQMCDKRGITYGEAHSIAALKASLIKFNRSHKELWAAGMIQLALHVSRDAQVERGHLLGFQAATVYRIPPPRD